MRYGSVCAGAVDRSSAVMWALKAVWRERQMDRRGRFARSHGIVEGDGG